MQARPCIFQPGNFTGWGSEGVKIFAENDPLLKMNDRSVVAVIVVVVVVLLSCSPSGVLYIISQMQAVCTPYSVENQGPKTSFLPNSCNDCIIIEQT